jgi:hypothetical protein
MHQLKRIKTAATSTKPGGNLVDVWKCNACKCQYEGAVGGPPPLPTDVCKPVAPAPPTPPAPAPAAPAKAEKKASVKPQAPKT